MKLITALIPVLTLGFGISVFANDVTVCKNGKGERRVEITYPDGKKVPCEVKYYKEGDEGKTLWNAQSDADYCEAKAKEFIAKLGSTGWQCATAGGEKAEAAEGSSDAKPADAKTK